MANKEPLPQRKRKIRRRVLILAVVLAVLLGLLALVVAWKVNVRKPVLPAPPTPSAGVEEPGSPGNVLSGDRKKDFFTFLVVGRDTGGGGNTDTIMVVAYDVPNQSVNVMNIYRDTMVNVHWDIKRINSVYNVLGMDGLKEHIKKLIGFAPDYYICVELEAFGELVDAIGGVDFEIPVNMNYDDPTQNLHIHFKKGMQHLSGKDAMKVIRWRKNNDGSGISVGDVGRVQIQQDFIRALAKQCLKIGNITKIGEFARIFSRNVDSDLTVGELVWFGQKALGLDADDIQFHTLPGNYNASAWSRTYQNYQSYVLPDGEAIVELVNQYFNPYYEPVTLDHLDIMSVNSDGSLSASGGVLADPKAATPPVKPKPTPKPSESLPEESQPPVEEGNPQESLPPVEEEEPGPQESQPPAEEGEAEESLPPAQALDPDPLPSVEPTPAPEPEPSINVLPARPVPVGT